MGSRKPAGVEAAAERLRRLLADVGGAVQALTEEVEHDEGQDQEETIARLGELHRQAVALAEKAGELLERARGIVASAEKRVENGNEFVSAFEDLVSGLESASETIDPDNWDWGDQGEGEGS